MVVKNEIPNQQISCLVRFQNKILLRVRFPIKFFTTCQILKQNFHNMSDFRSKILQCVGFCFKKTF